MKKFLKRLLLPSGERPYVIRSGALAGFRFYLDLQKDTQVWRGIYEQSLQRWLVEIIRSDSVCLDVGAAEGWVTLLMAKLAPQGTVCAFEPSERGDWIVRNQEINSERPLGKTVVERSCVGKQSSPATSELPPFIALDEYIQTENIQRVDVLKIDVDGPELDVLDGAQQVLERFHPVVCVEAHSHDLLEGVLERLHSARYVTEVVDPPPHEHRPIEYNPMVFASRKSP